MALHLASLLLALLLATETTQATTVQVQPDTLDLSGRTVVLSVDDGYHNVYVNIYPLLRRYRMTMTLALIGGCITSGRPSYRPEERFLNRSEVQEMVDSCAIEIASHTLSHAWLTRVDSASAWSEVYGSKTLLESLFDTRVVTFVYPYGDMNARARRMVRRAGYRLARAVRPGVPNFWVDPYRIPEIELRAGADLATVKRRIRQR
jgi:peptidoglycan/xylan/chitin deacetylase (PgdA/CDA1 family)